MASDPMLFAYWLPYVGIGSPIVPVYVPLTDVLNYRRSDGSLQVNVVNLMGCTFNVAENFDSQHLVFDPHLLAALTDGSVAQLQAAGIKVLLTIQGSGGAPGTPFGWGSLSPAQIAAFVPYLEDQILSSTGYALDGIDVDDEFPMGGEEIVPVVQAMRPGFNTSGKLITKALYAEDEAEMQALAPLLDYGGIMIYGDDPGTMEWQFNQYVGWGMKPEQMTIGVNAGPIEQGGGFTSIATAQTMAAWQPAVGQKLGMMIWSFSQDIQQFTYDPQNTLMWRNSDDHSWQQAIISIWEGNPPITMPMPSVT